MNQVHQPWAQQKVLSESIVSRFTLFRLLMAALLCMVLPIEASALTEYVDSNPRISQTIDLARVLGNPAAVTGKFGWANASLLHEADRPYLRVLYPARSYDPGSMLRKKMPVGGLGFRLKLDLPPSECMHLSYLVRFAPDFPFVKGGKLPGLGGGKGNTGGKMPNGSDGFSSRYMWRTGGAGEIYAYLPTSVVCGTSLGRGEWHFERGVWNRLEQTVRLNKPGRSDGEISVWLNGQLVHVSHGLRFRDTERLKNGQLIFETFFGGNTPDWAPQIDTYADFADVTVSTCY